MFSDLAFIDWIALLFAAVLLAAAAAAAIVAYATAKNRPLKPATHTHRPAHAATPARRSHAPEDELPEAPARQAMSKSTVMSASEQVVPGVPAPPVVSAQTALLDRAVIEDGVRIEPASSVDPERLAARAAKLRNRPIPEQKRKRVVSAVEPHRTPAHAPNRGVQTHPGGAMSIEKDHTDGFSARTPGFFEDPVGRHELRYWDGHRWTEYVKEHGERFTDPL